MKRISFVLSIVLADLLGIAALMGIAFFGGYQMGFNDRITDYPLTPIMLAPYCSIYYGEPFSKFPAGYFPQPCEERPLTNFFQ